MENIDMLKVWSQKVLPLVYDESLSYYEVLNKVASKINEVINRCNEMPDIIKEEIKAEINSPEFKEYVATLVQEYLEKGIPKLTQNDTYWQYAMLPYCDQIDYFPQGACFIDETTVVVAYALTSDNTTILQKVDLVSNKVLASVKSTAYHCNTLTAGESVLYGTNFFTDGETGKSNIISLFDSNTLGLTGTIEISELNNVGIRSATYRNGSLYIQDRDAKPSYWRYDLTTHAITKLFTFEYESWQMCYLDTSYNVWLLSPNNIIDIYDLNGNRIKTMSLPEISNDRTVVNIEFENIMESPSGKMFVSDIGWKLDKDGNRYNRHIICSLGEKLVNYGANALRQDNSNAVLVCTSNGGSYQSGNSDTPYDSIDYAGKVGTLYDMTCVITSNGSFIEQVADFSNAYIKLFNIHFSGYTADNCFIIETTNVTLEGDGAGLKKLNNLDDYCLTYLQAGCNARLTGRRIGTQNNPYVLVVNYNNHFNMLGSTSTNCNNNVVYLQANEIQYYGVHKPVIKKSMPTTMYRVDVPDGAARCGGEYGRYNVVLDKALETNFEIALPVPSVSPMLSFTLNYYMQTMDVYEGSQFKICLIEIGADLVYVSMKITVTDTAISFNNVTANKMDGSVVDVSTIKINRLTLF